MDGCKVASFDSCRNNYGAQIFLDAPLSQTPSNLVLKVVLGKLLPKRNLRTKFEVASFNGCRNSNFLDAPLFQTQPILVLKVVFGKLVPKSKLRNKRL